MGISKHSQSPFFWRQHKRLVFLMLLIQCLHRTVTTSCLSNSGGFPVSGAEHISLSESFTCGVYLAGFPRQSSPWHALLFFVAVSEASRVTPTEMILSWDSGSSCEFCDDRWPRHKSTSVGFVRGTCALKISVSQICSGTVQCGEDSECQNTAVPDIVLPGPHKLHIAQRSLPLVSHLTLVTTVYCVSRCTQVSSIIELRGYPVGEDRTRKEDSVGLMLFCRGNFLPYHGQQS